MINASTVLALGISIPQNSSNVSFAYNDVTDTFVFNVTANSGPPLTTYPDGRINPAGAIPVYYVATPPVDSTPPNGQNNILGAIPVITTAIPPGTDLAGAIPVRVVAAPGVGPWTNNQGLATGGIPVYESVATNAMPVWHT